MDALAARALKIQRRRDELIGEFPSLWQGMIKAWREPAEEPCAWLMYSANYLFQMNGVWWAMDPVRLHHRLPFAPEVNYVRDLDKLSFVLLTHEHGDHLDLGLIHLLRHLPIT